MGRYEAVGDRQASIAPNVSSGGKPAGREGNRCLRSRDLSKQRACASDIPHLSPPLDQGEDRLQQRA
jgi:hypothetical protein